MAALTPNSSPDSARVSHSHCLLSLYCAALSFHPLSFLLQLPASPPTLPPPPQTLTPHGYCVSMLGQWCWSQRVSGGGNRHGLQAQEQTAGGGQAGGEQVPGGAGTMGGQMLGCVGTGQGQAAGRASDVRGRGEQAGHLTPPPPAPLPLVAHGRSKFKTTL